ncbi:MAG: hypothetical protein KFF45_10160 [Thioalkalivibrio sp.]|nr:hypothetical protein [Thioalkalivibrio sp.]
MEHELIRLTRRLILSRRDRLLPSRWLPPVDLYRTKDLDDVPESVREEMEFMLADRIDDVLRAAIPELLPEDESDEATESSGQGSEA